MAEQRLQLLKKRLLKDGELLMKYRRTMQEYIVKGHAQRVQREELDEEIAQFGTFHIIL